MGTRRSAGLPDRLERARRRFERWRRSRSRGTRIPEGLWAAAVEAAREYGVSRTASVLRVDYYALKERLQEQAASSRDTPMLGEPPAFLELPTPMPRARGECVLELEDVDGAKMRIHLQGFEAPDLAALAQSFRHAAS